MEKLKKIMRMKEKNLLKYLSKQLKKYYQAKDIIVTKDYIYALGTTPIALVAHLDTVHYHSPVNFFYDQKQKVLWSPEGLGADDRAGVYSILILLEKGYRPSVIFTTKEEVGGIGASTFVSHYEKPLVETNFIIELDRAGKDDSVYYYCDNEDFEKYINSYGFKTDIGSFSDISIIAPKWDIAAVNLSIGYYNEHTLAELLSIPQMVKTINRVEKILKDTANHKKYDYIPCKNFGFPYLSCEVCGKIVDFDSLSTIYDETSKKTLCICDKCLMI